MSWIMAGMAAAGALTSMQSAKARQKQQTANLMANAEQIKYSPWTGMDASVKNAEAVSPALSALSGGFQGATSGAMMRGQFGGGQKMAPEVEAAQKELDLTKDVPMTDLPATGMMPNLSRKKRTLYDPSGGGGSGWANV